MKWMLIATMLQMQPVYDDQKTCEVAAEQIKRVYYQEAAVCIPMPATQISPGSAEADRVFESFLNMIQRMQEMQPKVVDK